MYASFARKLMLPTLMLALALHPVSSARAQDSDSTSRTPIKHVIVIFQENVSFDHYFDTYPSATANKDGSTYFSGAKKNTPAVNNLESAGLLTNNPNGTNPFKIDRSVPGGRLRAEMIISSLRV